MDIAAAIKDEAQKRSKKISFLIMEDYGKRPLQKLPEEIEKKLSQAHVSIFAAQSIEGEIEPVRRGILKIVQNKKIRHAHMVNISNQIMEESMSANYDKIKEFSEKVYNIVKNAGKIKVTSKQGTDLSAEFSPDTPWIISDGNITKDKWSNLPDGEVWTCVKNCNGKIVIDGVLGDYFSAKYGLLHENPLTLVVHDSVVRYVQCADAALKSDFERYIDTDENARRIGEFALGTNLAVKRLIGTMLQDEKFPGVHVAVGHCYPEKTGVSWSSSVHCDGVLRKPTVVVDGKKIMEDGRYLI
jgi:leucyl aminopeptidase (aminopeptidase T)